MMEVDGWDGAPLLTPELQQDNQRTAVEYPKYAQPQQTGQQFVDKIVFAPDNDSDEQARLQHQQHAKCDTTQLRWSTAVAHVNGYSV